MHSMHEEILELISTPSEATLSDRSSSVCPFSRSPSFTYGVRCSYTRAAIARRVGTMQVIFILGPWSSKSSSANSFSILPSKPKIFYGRESELEDIIKVLNQDLPRIAILGGGGMGKTTLAKAVLHHPDISTKFQHRFFVNTESANSSIELAALIGLHLGLHPRPDLTKPVVQHFSKQSPCLLILDNLETPWEPIQSRGGTEEFLSLLTDVEHLALIVSV